jgi:hypothetical protein
MFKLIPGFFVSGFLLLLSSCVSKRKITQLKDSVATQKVLLNRLDSTITALNNFSKEKNSIGELDDTSAVSINKLLVKEAATTKVRTDSLTDIQTKMAAKRVKKKEYKNLVTLISSGTSIISTRMETVDFIDQLLKQQTFIKFNTAAFFPSGAYKIPAEKYAEAKTIFSPLVDSLVGFVKRFPNMSIVSSIVSTGYADGQGFGEGGELVTTLTANLGKTEASKEELNMELSRLRAEEVAGVLIEIWKEKVQQLNAASPMNTRFFKAGKGEEYPNKKIKDYQVEDERRRIVVIYWNALPDKQ